MADRAFLVFTTETVLRDLQFRPKKSLRLHKFSPFQVVVLPILPWLKEHYPLT